MPDIHAQRRGRLRDSLHEQHPVADGLLVTGLVNVRYLTGFTGSNAVLLLPVDGDPLLGTDGRYVTQCARECPDLELLVDRATPTAVAAAASQRGLPVLGVEAEHVTLAGFDGLREAAPTATYVHTSGLVETLRTSKDDEEIALLREACRITDAALADLLPEIRVGLTERQVARRLESLMLDHGAQAPAFETIVATGPNSAIPHHDPTDREIAAGDLLKIDFGALYGGYHADETRTFVVGAPAQDWQRDLHTLVADAQRAGREALRDGAELPALDAAARDVIDDAGHADHYGHGLGHGVGLEIHEAPIVGPRATGRIHARTPVTVEPGVYLPDRGGVRIEDTLLVTADGAESLTTTTRELLVLG
ncbi:MAG: Xaa-Pro peptidase family protein [Candidatus Nanopelagicales bacterium]